jgi:hypothetical protein
MGELPCASMAAASGVELSGRRAGAAARRSRRAALPRGAIAVGGASIPR